MVLGGLLALAIRKQTMAFYDISNDSVSPALLIDDEVLELSKRATSHYNFDKEKQIVATYAHLVRKPAKPPKPQANTVVSAGEAKATEKGDMDTDTENKSSDEKIGTKSAASNDAAGTSTGDADKKDDAEKEEVNDEKEKNNIEGDSAAAASASSEVPVKSTDDVPTISNGKNKTGGDIPTVRGAEISNTNTEIPPPVSQPTLKREVSVGEKDAIAEVDAAMALLMEQDSKVTKMIDVTGISRDESSFYLESTDWNLEKAVEIYKSYTQD